MLNIYKALMELPKIPEIDFFPLPDEPDSLLPAPSTSTLTELPTPLQSQLNVMDRFGIPLLDLS